jgi:hypothetical protein
VATPVRGDESLSLERLGLASEVAERTPSADPGSFVELDVIAVEQAAVPSTLLSEGGAGWDASVARLW